MRAGRGEAGSCKKQSHANGKVVSSSNKGVIPPAAGVGWGSPGPQLVEKHTRAGHNISRVSRGKP